MNRLEIWKQYEGHWVIISFDSNDENIYGLETINEIYAKVWSKNNPMSQYVNYEVTPSYIGTLYIEDIRPIDLDKSFLFREEVEKNE